MIQYPTKKKPFQYSTVSVKNRGMGFETLIDESNAFYRAQNRAIIHKKPTPIQIVKVDYPSRTKAKITEAYYKTPSTTDYNGIYKGTYIDFDVKETRSKTAFPIKNIHAHQINHLKAVHTHDGIAFLLLYFRLHNTVYLLTFDALEPFVTRAINGRQSITYEEIQTHGYLVQQGYKPPYDYLSVVDKLIQKK